MVAKICIIVIFIGVVVGVGIYARQHTKSVDGFVLGGRSVGPWLSAFAFGTSYFSAVIFVGYAGQFGWKYGLAAFWIGVGNALLGSLLAWWVLGPRTREITQRLKATTMPEFFGKRYHSEALRIASAAIISTIFAFVVAGGSYFLGGFSRLFGDQITYAADGTPIYDSIIPTMLSGLPDILLGIVVVLVLSASMSTLSSLVLTSSSSLTLDLLKGKVIKQMSENSQVLWMRALIVVFVLISAVLALIQYTSTITFIAQLMSISWGALAGAFLGPLLWGLYSGRISKAAVWASFIVGIGLTVSNMIFGFISSPINCGALAMLLSLVVVPLVSLVTPAVPFKVKPLTREGAIDREIEHDLRAEAEAARN